MRYFSAFLFGILSACFALLLELLLVASGVIPEPFLRGLLLNIASPTTAFSALIVFASAEEISRFLFVRQFVRRFPFPEDSGKISLLFPGLLFGAGFSSLEIIFGIQNLPDGFRAGLLSVTAIHVFFSLFFFLFFSSWKEKTLGKIVAILLVAVSLHTLYNYLVLKSGS